MRFLSFMATSTAQRVCIMIGIFLENLFLSSYSVNAQQTCIVTDNGRTVCGTLQQNSQNSNKTVTKSTNTVEFDYIKLTLKNCKRTNSTVNCYFTLSTNKDGQPGFYCNFSKMFDSYGNEYLCQQGQLGQAKGRSGTDIYTWMLKDIPLTAIATFREIPNQVKKIPALEVGVAFSEERGSRPSNFQDRAVFRNISISD
jgi:hypothetical protein